jgi:drug/metabolite transporter (DMT)-like permease
MKKSTPNPATLYAMISLMILIWTVNFIAAKIAFRHMPTLMVVTSRLELAALVMSAIYFFAPRHTKLNREDVKTFVLLGIFGVVINQGGFSLGLKYTTVGHSAIIIAIAPVIVMLLAGLSGLESITRGKIIGIAFSFVGVIILASENGFGSFGSSTISGDLITATSVVGYSIYAVLAKRVVDRYDTVTMNFFNFLVAAVCILPLSIHEWIRLDWRSVGWVGWMSLAYMAVMSSVVGYLIYYWALRHMDASRLATTTYIEPVFATILGAIFLGERLTAHLLTGGGLVLTGVYITERSLGEDALPPDPA